MARVNMTCWPLLTSRKDDHIYIVLPYFNFCKFNNRRRLFIEFVQRMQNTPGVRLIVSEGKLDTDTEYDLPPLSARQVYRHFRFSYPTAFWLKENLINLAVERLPLSWKYMAWIDADVTFINDNWVRDTIERLSSAYDVVYLWETCVNLGSNGEATDKIDKSFGYMHTTSKYPYHQRAKYGFWHPGYALACTRSAYEKMGGLVDFAILGSGDRHMALALIGKVEWSAPGNIHPGYLAALKAFQSRAKGLRLGYIPGTIAHHWHGDKANRRYVERWDILTKGAYDPATDLFCVPQSRQHFLTTDAKARLEDSIKEYFVGRQEDGSQV